MDFNKHRPHVEIFTDGSCYPNPGPGGWGVILKYEESGDVIELCGGEEETTNNRMEMTAAIQALSELSVPSRVTLYTDSEYLRNGITSWIFKWRSNNWRTSTGSPVKNVDLWQELDRMCEKHNVQFRWVKGHNGHSENERCDELANMGRVGKKPEAALDDDESPIEQQLRYQI